MPDTPSVPMHAPRPAGGSSLRREDAALKVPAKPPGTTGALVLADGSVFWGKGIGAAGARVGEVCFNTSITG